MYHILTNVQNNESKSLQVPIDNRRGGLKIGLRSITYTVGWFNVGENQGVSNAASTKEVPPGLYGVKDLQTIIHEFTNAVLDINRANGLVSLTIPENEEIRLTDQLLILLGLDDGLNGQALTAGEYIGDRPVNFTNIRNLYVHLDQVNSNSNFINGAPSNLLTTVGVSDKNFERFGDIHTFRIISPEFKRLQNGTISELKISILDEYSKAIETNLPISITLEIK